MFVGNFSGMAVLPIVPDVYIHIGPLTESTIADTSETIQCTECGAIFRLLSTSTFSGSLGYDDHMKQIGGVTNGYIFQTKNCEKLPNRLADTLLAGVRA